MTNDERQTVIQALEAVDALIDRLANRRRRLYRLRPS